MLPYADESDYSDVDPYAIHLHIGIKICQRLPALKRLRIRAAISDPGEINLVVSLQEFELKVL